MIGQVRFAPQSGHARAICPFEDQGHRSLVSACRPAPVIRMRVTWIRRPPATMRSMLAVASPLDFAAAEGPPRKLQAFRLKPSPAFGWLLLQFSFLLHGRSAMKLGSVTSSHAPKRRLNVRFMSERHPLHL